MTLLCFPHRPDSERSREAVTALEKETFDIVLMDVEMPEMDGFQATSAIREREANSEGHVPIVALTAFALKGDEQRCLSAGMDAYVSKPLRTDELFATIERLLSKAWEERQAASANCPASNPVGSLTASGRSPRLNVFPGLSAGDRGALVAETHVST
jgi:two-component system sensor histidine kinase/response regulator